MILVLGGRVSTVLTQTNTCQANSLYPASTSVSAQGGTGSFTFNVSGLYGCTVSAFPSVGWITASLSQSSSSGTVNYTVAANTTTTARTGSIVVGTSSSATTSFGISQAAGSPPAVLSGDALVVGAMSLSNFQLVQNLPLPTSPNQKFCGSVQLAPGLKAEAYVPTALERTGNFSLFAGTFVDPMTTVPPGFFNATPFPSGIIPASRLADPFGWRISSGSGSQSPGCARFPFASPPFSSLYYVTPRIGDNQVLITSFDPGSIAIGSGSFTLTLRGRGFALAPDMRVSFASCSVCIPNTGLLNIAASGSGATILTPSTNNGVELTVSIPANLITNSSGFQLTPAASVQVFSSSLGLNSNTVQIPFTNSAGPFLTLSPSSSNFNPAELHVSQTVGTRSQVASFTVASSNPSQPLSLQTSITKITPTSKNWLIVSPLSGSTPQTFSVTIDATALPPGQYSALITVSGTAAVALPGLRAADRTPTDTKNIAVTANVGGQATVVSPPYLSFVSVLGSGLIPGPQPLGFVPLALAVLPNGAAHTFTASTSGGSWLSIDAATGNLPGSINVSVDPSGLAQGTYRGQILVYPDKLTQSSAAADVVLNVRSAADDQIVFGTYQQGGPVPDAQPRPLTTQADESGFYMNLMSEMNWLQVSPTNGETPQTLQFSVDPSVSGLIAGSHVAYATVIDQNTPDSIFVIKATLPVTTPPPPNPTPVITSIRNAASEEPFICPNGFVEIKGSNLANSTGPWTGDPAFASGNLPRTLGNVSVTINGKPAYVSYVSPVQVNVLAPLDTATGNSVPVIVTYNGLSSDPVMVPLRPIAPALFEYDFATQRVAATHADNSPVAPVGNYPGSHPAAPNETIQLWATGFGNTVNAIPDGKLVTASSPLANPVTVSVDGTIVKAAYAGLVGAGLYQINVTIPASARNGDLPITTSTQGLGTINGVILSVQR